MLDDGEIAIKKKKNQKLLLLLLFVLHYYYYYHYRGELDSTTRNILDK